MNISLKSCLKITLCIFGLYLGIHYWPSLAGLLRSLLGAAAPLLVGCALAYVLNLLMSFYEKHFFPRTANSKIIKSRQYTKRELEKLGFVVLPSKANFLFAKTEKMGGRELYLLLKEKGILVRHFSKERISDYCRITIGSREEMEELLKTIQNILEELL